MSEDKIWSKIKELWSYYFESNWIDLMKEWKLDQKTKELLTNIIENELKEIESLNSPEMKKKRLKEISYLIDVLFKSSDNYEKLRIFIDRIWKIIDNSIDWKIKAWIDLVILEDWKIEKWYEETPFYINNDKIKFHRAFWDWKLWLWIDTNVVKWICENNLLITIMNNEYLLRKQYKNSGNKSNKWEISILSEEDIGLKYEEKQKNTPPTEKKTNPGIVIQDTNPKLSDTKQDNNETEESIFWSFFESVDPSHKSISKYIRDLSKPQKKWDWNKDLFSEFEFLLTKDEIQKWLIQILEEVYKKDMWSKEWAEALIRYKHYEKQWESIFKKHWLHKWTSLLAYTESRVWQNAKSNAWAWWYFQFTEESGRNWWLKIDWTIDERNDPIKSAEAAAKYLKYLWDDWFDYEKFVKYKSKLTDIREYEVKENDKLYSVAKKLWVSWKILKEYNNISWDDLQVWQILKFPSKKSLNSIHDDSIKKDTFYLALACYNWSIVTKLKWQNSQFISNYNEYLSRLSWLIKEINWYSQEISIMYKTVNETNLIKYINRTIDIYKRIQWRYFNKQMKDWEEVWFFNNTINKLISLKNWQINLNIINEFKNIIYKTRTNKYNKITSKLPHLKYWYNEIIIQNLFYPANLFAVQNVFKKIESEKNKPEIQAQAKQKSKQTS